MDTAPLLRTYIKDDIHGIKTAILDLHINPDDILTLNGKTFRVKHWQKRIASGLGEFQGFHGNNYFVLKKPLLTSITANFITYLIILVQFKKFQNYQWNKLVLFKYCHQFLKNEQNEGHKRAKRHNSIKLYNYFTFFRNVDSFFKHNAFLFMACNKHLKVNTVFKNHRKSLIQHSELHLHFEWTKVH